MEQVVLQLLQYGTTPALVALAFSVGLLIKKIDENGKKDEERTKRVLDTLGKRIDELESRFEERLAVHAGKIEELNNRVSCVEREYLPREDHYKDTAGWRAELNRIFDVIIRQLEKQK
jgi:hypothetical protein